MQNVLIISCVFPPEPVVSANLSFDLATQLSKNHNVVVVSPKPTRPMGYVFSGITLDTYPFKHIILNSYTQPKSAFVGRFRESYSFGKACEAYIKANNQKISVIYLNTWPLLSQFFVVRAAKKFNIPTVLHIQDIYPEALINKLPKWLKSIAHQLFFPIESYTTKYSTSIVTISEGMQSLLAVTRNLQPSKIKVVYNWQDESRYLDDPKLENGLSTPPYTHLMFLGSLGPVANIDNLIRALSHLSKHDFRLTIAGEGSEKLKLKKLVQDLNLSNVFFKQAVASEAGQVQATADILLLSLKKGAAGLALPSKLPAYMFSAKPIIATVDIDSDTARVIKDSGCGWVVEPEQPEVLAKLIQNIQKMSKSDLIAMGTKGRDYALQHFAKYNNLSKLAGIIEKLIR